MTSFFNFDRLLKKGGDEMTRQSFDAIIIGSGTSAYYVADGLIKHNFNLAMIDERPYGGTCALRGCQPKKYLVCNAEAVAMSRHLIGIGINQAARTDWQAMQTLKNQFLKGRSRAEVKTWEERGVATFSGRAIMNGPNEIIVDNDHLFAKHIILATGATPRRTLIKGSEHVLDSEAFLDLNNLPDRIIFIGGGYISFEFAHVAIRAGAKQVSILHRSQSPLKTFDHDIVKTIIQASREEGINIVLNETPVSVEVSVGIDPVELKLTGATGAEYQADLIIEATGRVPNLTVLESGHGKVETGPHGVVVNDFLQSVSNPAVYAVGDCAAAGPMLATVADEQGKIVANNIIKGNKKTIDYSIIPSAVFTIPSIGSVGLTQEQAELQKLYFRINKGETTRWPSSMRIG
ncbi:MAG: NAD(P)/FAD-dependent oxidoreductase, partial [Gammaproteobacteria bacterium]|nr:NAD(P)/FAD-dependent oxidoreductase [Gammaproteobacteria bacterium]